MVSAITTSPQKNKPQALIGLPLQMPQCNFGSRGRLQAEPQAYMCTHCTLRCSKVFIPVTQAMLLKPWYRSALIVWDASARGLNSKNSPGRIFLPSVSCFTPANPASNPNRLIEHPGLQNHVARADRPKTSSSCFEALKVSASPCSRRGLVVPSFRFYVSGFKGPRALKPQPKFNSKPESKACPGAFVSRTWRLGLEA